MRLSRNPTGRCICIASLFILVIAAEASADDLTHRYYRGHHHPRRNATVVYRLPHRHRTVVVHGRKYYHHGHRYYRKYPHRKGYVVVSPPVGGVVVSIPIGSVRVRIGGVTYFHHGGVYYRPYRSRYIVVEPPRETVIVSKVPPGTEYHGDLSHGRPKRVAVTVDLLNVRSGAGFGFPVIARVHRGEILRIKGRSPEWYYVELPTGEYGWVMKKFTREAGRG